MTSITITHTHADGTLIEGSRKGDGVYEILTGLRHNWRYFRSIGQIGLGQSRDRSAQTWKIEQAAEALRAAGHEVTVTIDESDRRTFAEAEAERYARADSRADYHGGAADKAAARAEARWRAEHSILDGIPAGQPILVGHHSEGRHRRDLGRAEAHRLAARAESDRAGYHESRAAAAERYQARREAPGTTLRRIERLEAEARKIQRRLDGTDPYQSYGTPASGAYRERLESRLADISDEIAHWRKVIADQAGNGVKMWTRDDFSKGDFVQFHGSWYEVLRVSAKSVSIPAMINDGHIITMARARCTWTDTVPYHKVKGRKSAAEIAEILAEADRRETAAKAG